MDGLRLFADLRSAQLSGKDVPRSFNELGDSQRERVAVRTYRTTGLSLLR